MSSVAAVILAAGGSARLGRPKQTELLGGETLVARAIRLAQQAGLAPVVVVVRPGAPFADDLSRLGVTLVLNPNAEEGMASSIRSGVASLAPLDVPGVVLMTCDQVALTRHHLRALVTLPARLTGSRYMGRVGIPAYFPASCFAGLLQLVGDTGARELLRHAAALDDESLALDVDTEDDLRLALHWDQHHASLSSQLP